MYDVIIPLDKSHLKQLLVNINFIRDGLYNEVRHLEK